MEPLTSRGEGILRFWRHNRVNLAVHKAIRFESSENLDEHLFRYVGDTVLHFVKPSHPAGKAIKDNGCPFVTDKAQDSARRVASIEYIGRLALSPHWLHYTVSKRDCQNNIMPSRLGSES